MLPSVLNKIMDALLRLCQRLCFLYTNFKQVGTILESCFFLCFLSAKSVNPANLKSLHELLSKWCCWGNNFSFLYITFLVLTHILYFFVICISRLTLLHHLSVSLSVHPMISVTFLCWPVTAGDTFSLEHSSLTKWILIMLYAYNLKWYLYRRKSFYLPLAIF